MKPCHLEGMLHLRAKRTRQCAGLIFKCNWCRERVCHNHSSYYPEAERLFGYTVSRCHKCLVNKSIVMIDGVAVSAYCEDWDDLSRLGPAYLTTTKAAI